ncbi:MAG: DUF3857 domain-containing transglutaminase family protein [Flavobacterium sp.]|nr:DUF3857 domain-containing transglutaminase family protein [Flavobacterium sp.]
MRKKIFVLFLFIISASSFSQKLEYSILSIPDSLKTNANAVIRFNQKDIIVSSQKKMKISTKRVVTVFNEMGLDAIGAVEYYEKVSTINSMDAIVYNSFGKEIKKIKRSDFKDVSASGDGTMFSDNRVIFLDYTPTEYPFTVVYESEKTTSNTAFIPFWLPIEDYFISVEKKVLNLYFSPDLGFRKKEINFSKFKIEKTTESQSQLSYQVSNIVAKKKEANSPYFLDFFPKVIFGVDKFNLEGVDGVAKNWQEYGKWYYENLLKGTDELSDETVAKIKTLVGNESDKIAKAKIVYNYVQEKVRYVSVQVGIGGFKPMLAKDVDRLGYGDCKALSNYTRALLAAVGVESYYTELYGSSNKMSIEPDFFSVQGNHVILAIPKDNQYVFLECTSQDNPFGFQANFTDDRQAVLIKPEGGEVVKTKNYEDADNKQISKGSYKLDEKGDFSGKITIISEGTQYASKVKVEKMPPNEREAYFKEYWDNINDLKIESLKINNNKQKISFIIDAELHSTAYGSLTGNNMMFPINAFNKYSQIPQRYRSRNYPFEIERGFYDEDEIEIVIPENYTIEAKPTNYDIKDKFGEYKTEVVSVSSTKLVYKRKFLINKGFYDKSEYENYRKFMEQIAKADNSKIMLTKKE